MHDLKQAVRGQHIEMKGKHAPTTFTMSTGSLVTPLDFFFFFGGGGGGGGRGVPQGAVCLLSMWWCCF